jgi:hypothetical protein
MCEYVCMYSKEMQCPFYLIPLKLCIIEETDEERDPLFEILFMF